MAREREIYLGLLLKRAVAQGVARRLADEKIRIVHSRIDRLITSGVRSFACKYGPIPIVIRPDLTHLQVK